MDQSLLKFLPDLICDPLLTSINSDLKCDSVLSGLPQSHLPQSSLGSQPSVSPVSPKSDTLDHPASPSPSQSPSRSSSVTHYTSYPNASHHNHTATILPVGYRQLNADELVRKHNSALNGDLRRDSSLIAARHRNAKASGKLESCSLETGLDLIRDVTIEAETINKASGQECGSAPSRDFQIAPFVEGNAMMTRIKNATGSLINISDIESLTVISQCDDLDEGLICYEEQTTELLRCWQEGDASHVAIAGSSAEYLNELGTTDYLQEIPTTDYLQELGVEVTENFMKQSPDDRSQSVELVPSTVPIDDNKSASVSLQDATELRRSSIPDVEISCSPNENSLSDQSRKVSKPCVKTKTKGFWPFSRSNTSDESSKDSTNSVSDKMSSLDSNCRVDSLDGDDSGGHQSTRVSVGASPTNSSAPVSDSCPLDQSGSSFLPPGSSSGGTVVPPVVSPRSPLGTSSGPPGSSSGHPTGPVTTANRVDSDGTPASDPCCSGPPPAAVALLEESLAALEAGEDLSDVASRTARLASKTFSFKMGAK